MITLPKTIARLRPRPSVMTGTRGREMMAPREYMEDMRPRRVERGEWKTAIPVSTVRSYSSHPVCSHSSQESTACKPFIIEESKLIPVIPKVRQWFWKSLLTHSSFQLLCMSERRKGRVNEDSFSCTMASYLAWPFHIPGHQSSSPSHLTLPAFPLKPLCFSFVKLEERFLREGKKAIHQDDSGRTVLKDYYSKVPRTLRFTPLCSRWRIRPFNQGVDVYVGLPCGLLNTLFDSWGAHSSTNSPHIESTQSWDDLW